MNRLGRMQKVTARAGRCQRGHDLLTDEARLAHATDDDAATHWKQQLHGLTKLRVESGGQLGYCPCFDLNDVRVAQLFKRGELGRKTAHHGSSFCAHRLVILDFQPANQDPQGADCTDDLGPPQSMESADRR